MELINDIQIEVTEIVIKKVQILDKRTVFFFKRRIFMGEIQGVSEESYLVENNFSKCAALYVDNEGWIKVRESFTELAELHSEWWQRKTSTPETTA